MEVVDDDPIWYQLAAPLHDLRDPRFTTELTHSLHTCYCCPQRIWNSCGTLFQSAVVLHAGKGKFGASRLGFRCRNPKRRCTSLGSGFPVRRCHHSSPPLLSPEPPLSPSPASLAFMSRCYMIGYGAIMSISHEI